MKIYILIIIFLTGINTSVLNLASFSNNIFFQNPVYSKTSNFDMDNIEESLKFLDIPNYNTDSFREPSTYNLIKWQNLIKIFIEQNTLNKDHINIKELAEDLNYEVLENKDFFILKEKSDNFKGLGTYIFSKKPETNVVIEIPHPIFDTNTLIQGIKSLKYLKPKALFIAGTHRCSNCKNESYFEGKTSVCNIYCNLPKGNNIYRESDVGHFDRNFFHYAHKTFNDFDNNYFFQFHTASDKTLYNKGNSIDMILSYGIREKVDKNSKLASFANKLKGYGIKAFLNPNEVKILSGSTNVQGKYTNKCISKNCKNKGRFIHLEQRGALIKNPEKIFDSIKSIFN